MVRGGRSREGDSGQVAKYVRGARFILPHETVMADVTARGDPREIPRLRVPTLRAEARARDTPLGMTTQRPFALREWITSSQVSLPGMACHAPTKRGGKSKDAGRMPFEAQGRPALQERAGGSREKQIKLRRDRE